MKQLNEQAQTQRMTVYFSPELLAQVRESAKKNRRSFNQEALWLMEQGLEHQIEKPSLSAVGVRG